jgi:hypothetical protein
MPKEYHDAGVGGAKGWDARPGFYSEYLGAAATQAAVAETSADGGASPLVCLRLWALVHSIAKLILEGGVRPADYGLTSGEALTVRLLQSGQ